MNYFYLLSGIVTRLCILTSSLVAFYFLNSSEFGYYQLSYSNSLFFQLFFGAWLSTYAVKYISLDSSGSDSIKIFMSFYFIALLLPVSVVTFSYLFFFNLNELSQYVIFTSFCTISFVAYECAQAINNGQQDAARHAMFSILRAALTLFLISASVLIFPNDYRYCIGSVILANLIPSIPTMKYFKIYRKEYFKIPNFGSEIDFILNSMILYGYYVICLAIVRNTIAIYHGVELSGKIGFLVDILFAPLALLSSSLSMSYLPKMYKEAANRENLDGLIIQYIRIHHVIFLAYVTICSLIFIFFWNLLPHKISNDLSFFEAMALIAFSAAIMLKFAYLTILLASGENLELRWLALSSFALLGVCAIVAGEIDLNSHSLTALIAGIEIATVMAGYVIVMKPRERVKHSAH